MFFNQRGLCLRLIYSQKFSWRLASLNSSLSIDLTVRGFGWSKKNMPNLMLCKLYHLTKYSIYFGIIS